MTQRDFYEVLGIAKSASPEEIKKAYRRKARQYHPDVSEEQDAEERFKEVQRAYEVLSDNQKRAAYDRFGHAGVDGMGGQGFSGGFEGFGGFADIFEDLFAGFGGASRRRRNGPQRGADLRHDLTLEFEEAVFGVEKDVQIRRPEVCTKCHGTGGEPGTKPVTCHTCKGSGEVRVQQSIFVTVTTCPTCQGTGEEIPNPCTLCHGQKQTIETATIKVKVPPGVDNDTQIRLTGEGGPGLNGGPAGNVYVVIHVRPHKYFKRRGNDIFLDLQINIAQAALGDTILIPTLDGEEEFEIIAGIQPGEVIKLRNKGVPRLDRSGRGAPKGRGDQHVIVQVAIPKKLSDEQRELFEKLGDTMGKEVKPHERGFWSHFKDSIGDVFNI